MVKRTNNSNRFSKLVHRLGYLNLAIIVGFVALFAGAGTYYTHRSLADAPTGYCVYYKLYEYRPGFYGSQCVKDVQFALTKLGFGPYSLCWGNYCDGIFGPQTEADVLRFGYDAGGYNSNGQVGVRVWNSLCQRGYNYPWVANNMGCNNPDQYWGSL